MKRHEKFVLEAKKIIRKVLNIDIPTTDVSFANYANPPIPEGYKHICGKWNNGYVIERCSDGSQFVWVPAGSWNYIKKHRGISVIKRFKDSYSLIKYHYTTSPTGKLEHQLKSVKKYGGFYISRYNISKNEKTGKPQSIKGVMPWVNINLLEAEKVASTIEDNGLVQSHITFDVEYDLVLEWFIKSHARTDSEIKENSANWGYYYYYNNYNNKYEVAETGSREEWCTNNIYDLSGNVRELTYIAEENSDCYRLTNAVTAIRGCDFSDIYRKGNSVARRGYPGDTYADDRTGFRAVLCIR